MILKAKERGDGGQLARYLLAMWIVIVAATRCLLRGLKENTSITPTIAALRVVVR